MSMIVRSASLAVALGAQFILVAFIVGAFIVAAIFTPPDVVSQLLLAIPLVVLYELGIIVARFVEKPKPAVAPSTSPPIQHHLPRVSFAAARSVTPSEVRKRQFVAPSHARLPRKPIPP